MTSDCLTWVEISRSALRHQVRMFKAHIGDVALYPVVKGNAYGHGMLETGAILDTMPEVAGFFVANLDEAFSLQSITSKRVSILSYWQRDEKKVRQAIRSGISFPIYDRDQARWLDKVAKKLKRRVLVHLKVDVGTSRIGFRFDAFRDLTAIFAFQNLAIKGLFSHFADSENSDEAFTQKQNERFLKVARHLAEQGHDVPLKHIACSAATIRHNVYHFDAVRVGISLYGMWPSRDIQKIAMRRLALKPVMTWKTRIIQIKDLIAGDTIGYGMTYRAVRSIRIATIPVGYWDGYDRSLSNRGHVLIRGVRCKVRGNVCMNLTMVEIPRSLKARVGDEVVLLGNQGGDSITAEEMALWIGTINYEVTTRINPVIQRISV